MGGRWTRPEQGLRWVAVSHLWEVCQEVALWRLGLSVVGDRFPYISFERLKDLWLRGCGTVAVDPCIEEVAEFDFSCLDISGLM